MDLNIEKIEEIATEAVAKLETSTRPDAKRWINAINKAVAELTTNPYVNWQDGGLLILSETSGNIYTANGICQCVAYANGHPCRHRAAARLVQRYLEQN